MLRLDHLCSRLVLELYVLLSNAEAPFQFGKLVFDQNHFTTHLSNITHEGPTWIHEG